MVVVAGVSVVITVDGGEYSSTVWVVTEPGRTSVVVLNRIAVSTSVTTEPLSDWVTVWLTVIG